MILSLKNITSLDDYYKKTEHRFPVKYAGQKNSQSKSL